MSLYKEILYVVKQEMDFYTCHLFAATNNSVHKGCRTKSGEIHKENWKPQHKGIIDQEVGYKCHWNI